MVDILKRDWVAERWAFNRDNFSDGFNSNFNGGGDFSSKLSVAEVLLVLKEIQAKLAEQIQKGDDEGWPIDDDGVDLGEDATKKYKENLDSVIANLEAKKVKNKEWIDIDEAFSDEDLVKEWKKLVTSHQEAEQWITAGINPEEYKKLDWLLNTKSLTDANDYTNDRTNLNNEWYIYEYQTFKKPKDLPNYLKEVEKDCKDYVDNQISNWNITDGGYAGYWKRVENDLKTFKKKDMEDGMNAVLVSLKTFAEKYGAGIGSVQEKTKRYESIEESIRKFVPAPTTEGDWKDIHVGFENRADLVNLWTSRGFTYDETNEYVKVLKNDTNISDNNIPRQAEYVWWWKTIKIKTVTELETATLDDRKEYLTWSIQQRLDKFTTSKYKADEEYSKKGAKVGHWNDQDRGDGTWKGFLDKISSEETEINKGFGYEAVASGLLEGLCEWMFPRIFFLNRKVNKNQIGKEGAKRLTGQEVKKYVNDYMANHLSETEEKFYNEADRENIQHYETKYQLKTDNVTVKKMFNSDKLDN